jgi:hypothetical protein
MQAHTYVRALAIFLFFGCLLETLVRLSTEADPVFHGAIATIVFGFLVAVYLADLFHEGHITSGSHVVLAMAVFVIALSAIQMVVGFVNSGSMRVALAWTFSKLQLSIYRACILAFFATLMVRRLAPSK